MSNSERYQKVNEILSKWNPIGVDDFIVDDEYKGYVPRILECPQDEASLTNCLEKILDNIGLNYKRNNVEHVEDLKTVCQQLLEVLL